MNKELSLLDLVEGLQSVNQETMSHLIGEFKHGIVDVPLLMLFAEGHKRRHDLILWMICESQDDPTEIYQWISAR